MCSLLSFYSTFVLWFGILLIGYFLLLETKKFVTFDRGSVSGYTLFIRCLPSNSPTALKSDSCSTEDVSWQSEFKFNFRPNRDFRLCKEKEASATDILRLSQNGCEQRLLPDLPGPDQTGAVNAISPKASLFVRA
jgi:hypothetical protein